MYWEEKKTLTDPIFCELTNQSCISHSAVFGGYVAYIKTSPPPKNNIKKNSLQAPKELNCNASWKTKTAAGFLPGRLEQDPVPCTPLLQRTDSTPILFWNDGELALLSLFRDAHGGAAASGSAFPWRWRGCSTAFPGR